MSQHSFKISICFRKKEKNNWKMAVRTAISIGRRANPVFLSANSAFSASKFRSNFPPPSFNHIIKPGHFLSPFFFCGFCLVVFDQSHDEFWWIYTGFRYSVRAIQGTTVDPITPKKEENQNDYSQMNWKIKMLYDGDCPLCMREVILLIKTRMSLY